MRKRASAWARCASSNPAIGASKPCEQIRPTRRPCRPLDRLALPPAILIAARNAINLSATRRHEVDFSSHRDRACLKQHQTIVKSIVDRRYVSRIAVADCRKRGQRAV
jgi:hypothetical protein